MMGLTTKVATAVLLLGDAATGVRTRSQTDQEYGHDRIPLEKVQVLTLHDSRFTAGRRSAPVPQLVCQGGCGQWAPDTVQCYNMGSDGMDAAWKCEATMPQGYSFSSVEVGCEGYDYPEDPYVLKGSCQLIYSLKPPPRESRSNGRAYDDDGSFRSWEDGNNPTWDGRPRSQRGTGAEKSFGSRLLTWAVLGVFGYVFFNFFLRHVPAGAGESCSSETGWAKGFFSGISSSAINRPRHGLPQNTSYDSRGGTDNSSSGPPPKGGASSTPTAPPPPEAAGQGGGVYPWLAGGGIGAALGYMLRPRQRRRAPAAGGMAWNRGYGTGNVGGGGGATFRRR
ncbi:unnamed protein product, partial [Scytosiphon promiscuus]